MSSPSMWPPTPAPGRRRRWVSIESVCTAHRNIRQPCAAFWRGLAVGEEGQHSIPCHGSECGSQQVCRIDRMVPRAFSTQSGATSRKFSLQNTACLNYLCFLIMQLFQLGFIFLSLCLHHPLLSSLPPSSLLPPYICVCFSSFPLYPSNKLCTSSLSLVVTLSALPPTAIPRHLLLSLWDLLS